MRGDTFKTWLCQIRRIEISQVVYKRKDVIARLLR